MFVSILIIILNILFYFLYKSFNKGDNDYSKEKIRFNKLRLKYIFRYINIGYIIIYLIHLIFILLYVGITKIEYYYIYFILLSLDIISYIILEYLTKCNKQKFKLIDKKLIDNRISLLVIAMYILFIIEKVTFNYNEVGDSAQKIHNFLLNYHLIIRIICVLIILYSFRYIIDILVKNKDYCNYTYDKEYYLEDIKFYSKIDIKRGVNHLIYIAGYILFFYINIPFIYIFYLLLAIFLIYLIYRKIKKISFESDKLNKTISFTGVQPGIIYAFQFTRDILLLKKMIIFTIMLVFSTIAYYGLGESIFSYTSISIYLILLYTIIKDKVYLIRYLSSLNDRFIDKKKYSISEYKIINYIDTIKIFNITLYKLIIVDTITYESNIILYDPELKVKELNIRINKSNIDDYITIENILYEE